MHPRTIVSVGYFFIVLSVTLFNYSLLSYLSVFIPQPYAGLVITIGASFALITFLFLPRLVARYGAQRLALLFAFAEMILLFALSAVPSGITGVICIILTMALQPLLLYELDLLLEATVEEESITGRVRTLFLTAGNLGALTAPFLMGVLLKNADSYHLIFFAGAVALVPFITLFVGRQLPKTTLATPAHIRDTFAYILHNHDLASVTIAHFVLYLFYIWAPFYIPIYLNSVLHIPWITLGWMFSIMLVPYILIEYPAGWIADKILGDKELMVTGFIIAGLSLASMSILTPTSSISLILGILILTRIGASLVESMTEGHFFRRVSEKDITSVSIFRSVWPLAYIVAPIIASGILYCSDYPFFFILTGGIVAVAGSTTALCIKDFR
jgi:MFS family permease